MKEHRRCELNQQVLAHRLHPGLHAHLMGIGGAGMNGLADALAWQGVTVSGCDLQESQVTKRLRQDGISVQIGHSSDHLAGIDLLVLSSAIQRDNPEVLSAQHSMIPVVGRAEALAAILYGERMYAVCGTHGKTTTTAMFYTILDRAGWHPNLVVGGKMPEDERYARKGESNIWVVEADESDASFLNLRPSVVILTNVDTDHLDNYGSLEAIEEAFARFLLSLPEEGWAVLNMDCSSSQRLISCHGNILSFGQSPKADVRAEDLRLNAQGSHFQVYSGGCRLGQIDMGVPGKHNVFNALACIAAAQKLGISFEDISGALVDFRSVARRLERKGYEKGILVFDDYAHHPTAIRRAIEAARLVCERDLRVVFQPHRYSRTQRLMKEFGCAFGEADEVIVTDVYGSGEAPMEGVNGRSMVASIRASGHPEATHLVQQEMILDRLIQRSRPGDLVVTLGAGDVYRIAERFLDCLRKQA